MKDGKLLKKYNKICVKVSISTKKEFNSKPIESKKYLKTKIKSYKGKSNKLFHSGKSTEGQSCNG